MSDLDDMEYETISISDGDDMSDEEFKLDSLAKEVEQLKLEEAGTVQPQGPKEVQVTRQPETIDDFVRNFLSRTGMVKTLTSFQEEWHDAQSRQQGYASESAALPDIYMQNQLLEERVRAMGQEMARLKSIVDQAKGTYHQLERQRDFHKMNHKRVIHEKSKLMDNLRRMTKHVDRYEPALHEMERRYTIAMKEKMVTKLERDRLADKLKHMGQGQPAPAPTLAPVKSEKKKKPAPKQTIPAARLQLAADDVELMEQRQAEAAGQERTPIEMFRCLKTIQAHDGGVNAVYPICNNGRDVLVLSAGDDGQWKMFDATSDRDTPLVSGHGHEDWVSSVAMAFPDGGTRGVVVTTGGSQEIMLWDVARGTPTLLKTEETPVWSVDFHHTGEFFLTSSRVVRLWDVEGNERVAFREHQDAVNSVRFRPQSALFCTASADNSVSIWDPRVDSACVQTVFHQAAANDAAFSPCGTYLASCSADGLIAVHDLRAPRSAVDTTVAYPSSQGGFSANSIAIDRTGRTVVCGTNNAEVRVLNLDDRSISTLEGNPHQDMVNSVRTWVEGGRTILCTGSSDGTVKVWGE